VLPGGGGGSGGGIFAKGKLIVSRSHIYGNRAGNGGTGKPPFSIQAGGTGGGIHFIKGDLSISETSVTDNHSGSGGFPLTFAGAGGGLYLAWADAVIERSTISGNRIGTTSNEPRGSGSGIFVDRAHPVATTLQLSSVTVTANEGPGGGLVVMQENGRVDLFNSIVAGNTDAGRDPIQQIDCWFRNDNVATGFNLYVEGGGCPANGTSVHIKPQHLRSKLLEPLADNGGPTPTHALHPSSPAIDAGYCPDESTDQRGYGDPSGGRAVDLHKKDPESACDIGAFELRAVPVVVAEVAPKTAGKEGAESSGDFALQPVYPNPSQGVTRSSFSLGEPQKVRVALFDILGREVQKVWDGYAQSDRLYELTITGESLPAGNYFLRLAGESGALLRTLVIAN
jgi:hypothetical protein